MNAFTSLLITELIQILEKLFISHESDIEHAINLDIEAIGDKLTAWVKAKEAANNLKINDAKQWRT
jgi:hypothetical protein